MHHGRPSLHGPAGGNGGRLPRHADAGNRPEMHHGCACFPRLGSARRRPAAGKAGHRPEVHHGKRGPLSGRCIGRRGRRCNRGDPGHWPEMNDGSTLHLILHSCRLAAIRLGFVSGRAARAPTLARDPRLGSSSHLRYPFRSVPKSKASPGRPGAAAGLRSPSSMYPRAFPTSAPALPAARLEFPEGTCPALPRRSRAVWRGTLYRFRWLPRQLPALRS